MHGQVCNGKGTAEIVQAFTIILIQVKRAVCPGSYLQFHFLRGRQRPVMGLVRAQGHHGAGFQEDRHFFQRTIDIHRLSAIIDIPVHRIHPGALRQPHTRSAKAAAVRFLRDRRGHHFAAEPVDIGHFIGFLHFRRHMVHRPDERKQVMHVSPVHGIEIREQPVAQAHEIRNDIFRAGIIFPRLSPEEGAVSGMQAEHR